MSTSLSKQPLAVICLSHNKGGMELASFKLASLLNKHVDTTFIIQKGTFLDDICEEEENITLNVETVTFKSSLSLSLIYQLRHCILKYNIKNIIFVGASELKSLYFSLLGLEINLIVRHGTNKSTPKKDFFHRLIYSKVATHVAISDHLLHNVKQIIPFGKKTLSKVIYPSLSQAIVNSSRSQASEIKLLHVGRIAEGKGFKEACDACEILFQNNIKFHLDSFGATDKNYKPYFFNYYQSLPYKDSITLMGFIKDIYQQYTLHDIFIFPSKGEGFGNVFMEAISHGMICLAYANTSFNDFYNLGFHIHLVEDSNVKALQEKLLEIVQNIEEEKKLARTNIAKANKVFNPQREANEYMDLLV